MARSAAASLVALMAAACSAKAETACDPIRLGHQDKRAEITIEISCDVRRDPALEYLVTSRAKRDLRLDRKTAADIHMSLPSQVDVSIKATFVHPHMISLLETRSEYFGGPHGMTHFRSTIWDIKRHHPLGLAQLLTDARSNGPALRMLARLTRHRLADQWRETGHLDVDDPDQYWNDSIKPDADTFKHLVLESGGSGKASGLRVYFEPYHVTGYADGPQSVYLPFSAVEKLIRSRYRPVFESR